MTSNHQGGLKPRVAVKLNTPAGEAQVEIRSFVKEVALENSKNGVERRMKFGTKPNSRLTANTNGSVPQNGKPSRLIDAEHPDSG